MEARVDRVIALYRRIIVVEIVGFSLGVCGIWADEFLNLPALLFGPSPQAQYWGEAEIESLWLIGLGVLTVWSSVRLMREIGRLRSFVVMCAWCRKIRVGGEWVPIENYLASERRETTHGVCEDCARQWEAGRTTASR